MRFVAKYTSILVPKVYTTFKYKERTYIIIERISSKILAHS